MSDTYFLLTKADKEIVAAFNDANPVRKSNDVFLRIATETKNDYRTQHIVLDLSEVEELRNHLTTLLEAAG
jgi:propanediol dehydratase small subunit